MHNPLHIWLLGGPPEGSRQLLIALQKAFAEQALIARSLNSPLLPAQWGTPSLVLVWGWQHFDDDRQAQTHNQLRSHLQAADVEHQVIYQHGADGNTSHLHNALRAVQSGLKQYTFTPAPPPLSAAPRWLMGCEKCSDPVCEHRLFTGLIKQG